jgi:diguanylate cyclase (GGDEF)-like protein/PAS domain S-box-containing protein
MPKSKQRAAEPAPAENDDHEHLRIVVEGTPIAIIVGDGQGHVVLANGHAQLLFGYGADELVGRDAQLLLPKRLHAEYRALRDEFLHAPAGRKMDAGQQLFGLRKDGTEVPIEIGLNPVETRRGAFVLVAIVDITQRIEAEERHHSDEQMRLVIDGAADAMIDTDKQGRVTLVNSQVERTFGYLRQDLLDRWVPEMTRGEFMLASVIEIAERKHADDLRAAGAAHAAEIGTLTAEMQTIEKSLVGSEEQLRRKEQRLESLWRLVNTPALRGQELVLAMLREASTALRPGHLYLGTLGHIDGTAYVLDAVAGGDGRDAGAISRVLRVGERLPLNEMLFTRDLSAGRTQSWTDCQAISDLPTHARKAGLQSQIATQLTANANVFILTLSSLDPPASTDAFGPDDNEYIEVLGSFFARHLEQERLEGSLRDAESRARQHAERLTALWQVANNPKLRGQSLMLAMLGQAAAAIRPSQTFHGLLGRIEGDEVVVIGVSASTNSNDAISRVRIGRRTPLTETMIPSDGGTRAWSDLSQEDAAPKALSFLGWRAALSTRFQAGGAEYWLTFGSPQAPALPFGPDDFAYIDVLASSFANQLQLGQLEVSLRDEEERSRQHAERLEGLRKIVNNPNLQDQELLQAMLRQAAESIRPGQNYRGVLWFIDGADLAVKAVASSLPLPHDFPRVGSSIPIGQTVIGFVASEGRGTRSWDDFQASEEHSPLARMQNTRSLIVTTFSAGASSWGLSFASSEKTHEPLGPQDHAYIEVLAAFFANHLQQRWQYERIQYQQSHDALTGLLSRSQFRSQARAAARINDHYAIVLVNIDAFREINESRGHMIGDAVLVEVGHALRSRAVGDEIVGRIEGDVFGIFIPNPASKHAVKMRADDFAAVFSTAFLTGDRDGTDLIARTGTVGIAVAPDDGTIIDGLLSHAGAALLNAKEHGFGSMVFYEPGMEGDAPRRTALRNELAEAVAEDQFTLYYQPHVEVATGNVSGCEALIRWQHPQRGLLLPSQFIPFAEEHGIIASIDAWVMQHALAAANELAALRPDFRVYFNLSGRQAGDSKVIRAFTIAARNGVRLGNVGVEITESDAMRDIEGTRIVCRALRRLNIRIAIDDFGTGYSSSSSLKRLPVDIVKIDQSFVSGILTDPHDATIAETIISITKHFGFDALAEGVERLEEVEWLRKRSCRYMQGFAVCRPLAFDAFKLWLGERPHRVV